MIKPLIIDNKNENGIFLNRIEIAANSDKSEKWLQDLIFKNIDILPIKDFAETIDFLIPLSRELSTNVGYIDILCVSQSGKIVIIETKLWKNPEKHREVVAQIIDYAKEIANYTLDEFIMNVNTTLVNNEFERFIDSFLKSKYSYQEFLENLIKNIETGEFLLLIVGDRISPNVALLSKAIHGNPVLNFTIGLIELQIFKGETDYPLYIFPQILGRTVEEVRGIIKIKYQENTQKPKVEVVVTEEDDNKNKINKDKVTRDIFLNDIPQYLKDTFANWLMKIENINDTILNFGVSGFTYNVKIKGTDKYERVGYFSATWGVTLLKQNENITAEIYDEYIKTISKSIPFLKTINAKKIYTKFEDLTNDDLITFLSAIDKIVEKLK